MCVCVCVCVCACMHTCMCSCAKVYDMYRRGLGAILCSSDITDIVLKLQSFGHLIQRVNSLEKTLMLERLRTGGEGGDRG